MAIVIHHGSSGSYKSFSSVQDHVIPALQKGYKVISNIRNLSIDGVVRYVNMTSKSKDPVLLPDSAEIIYINTDNRKGRDHLARWWHWAPNDCVILIDEAQKIYSSQAKKFKPELLNFEGGEEAADRAGRPYSFEDAIDEHRHHNWDIYLCTTHIDKINKEIRQTAEEAIKHVNVSNLLPWFKNTWYEHRHNPDNNGSAKSHYTSRPVRKNADERIFKAKVYDSTKTGEHKQSEARQPIYKDKTLMGLLFVFVVFASITIIGGLVKFQDSAAYSYFVEEDSLAVKEVIQADIHQDPVFRREPADNVSDSQSGNLFDVIAQNPISDSHIQIVGSFNETYFFRVQDDDGIDVDQSFMHSFGYTVEYISGCIAKLSHLDGSSRFVYCDVSPRTPLEDNPSKTNNSLFAAVSTRSGSP